MQQAQQEYDRREQPSIFIPRLFYQARADGYRYWQLARLAHGKKAYFSYYFYDSSTVEDDDQDFVFYVDEKGEQKQQKNVFSVERVDIINNPLFEKVYRQYYQQRTPAILLKGNLLMAYHTFVHKQTDLDNYLQYKPLTPMDLLRGSWYAFMTKTGFTNAYRYDHIMSRPDWLYEYDVAKMALNINKKDFDSKFERHLKGALMMFERTQSTFNQAK